MKLRYLLLALLIPFTVQAENVQVSERDSQAQTSLLNSSTTALAGDATFTGTGELNSYPQVGVMTYSDVSGTLYFDFSNDGTNWDSTYPSSGFACAAGVSEFHTAVKLGRYFRVRYVNDSSAQSTFRLKTYYGANFAPSVAPLNQTAGLDQDAIFTRGTIPEDEIARGKRSGVTKFVKWGYNNDVDTTSDPEVVASFGGTSFTPMTSADTFNIAYNDTTDGAGNNGALTLFITYIDANGLPATATHTLDGTTPDTTAFTGLGINRVAVSSTGTADVNTNAITFTDTSGSFGTQAQIPAGESVTQQGVFFTGSNHTAIGRSATINIARLSGSTPRVTVDMWIYNRGVDTKFKIFSVLLDTSVENTHRIAEFEGFQLNATDVLWFEATTNTDNTPVQVRYEVNQYQLN